MLLMLKFNIKHPFLCCLIILNASLYLFFIESVIFSKCSAFVNISAVDLVIV